MVFNYSKLNDIKNVKMCIYKITNLINNKIYIGKTQSELILRVRRHCHEARIKTNRYFYDSINHYGWDNFSVNVIEVCPSLSELNNREIFWIDYYKSNNKENGYNLTIGGDGSAFPKEALKKSADKRRGVPVSDETKRKISEGNKGRFHVCSKETKRKISELKLKKLDKDQIIVLTKQGICFKQIANILNTSVSNLRSNLNYYFNLRSFKKFQDQLGIEHYKPNQTIDSRKKCQLRIGELNSNYKYFDIDQFADSYFYGKKPLSEVLLAFGISQTTLYAKLKKENYNNISDLFNIKYYYPLILKSIKNNLNLKEIASHCKLSESTILSKIRGMGYASLKDARQKLLSVWELKNKILSKEQSLSFKEDLKNLSNIQMRKKYKMSKTSFYRYKKYVGLD